MKKDDIYYSSQITNNDPLMYNTSYKQKFFDPKDQFTRTLQTSSN